jgi:acyl carrier protein
MKTHEEILESLKRIAAETADLDASQVSVTASLRNDLGLDSLDMIDVITSIEDELGIRLTDVEASKIETITDFVNALYNAQRRVAAAT